MIKEVHNNSFSRMSFLSRYLVKFREKNAVGENELCKSGERIIIQMKEVCKLR